MLAHPVYAISIDTVYGDLFQRMHVTLSVYIRTHVCMFYAGMCVYTL